MDSRKTRLDLETSRTGRGVNLCWSVETQASCVSVLDHCRNSGNETEVYSSSNVLDKDNKCGDNPSKLYHDWIIILLIQLNAIDNGVQNINRGSDTVIYGYWTLWLVGH